MLCLNFVLYFQLIGTTEEAFSAGLMAYFLLAGVAILYANIAIAVKRLHDIGYGGFLAVAILIPDRESRLQHLGRRSARHAGREPLRRCGRSSTS